METSELPFAKKNIIRGDSVENCSNLINMRGWLHSFETIDASDKSMHPSTKLWELIMYGKIPEDLEMVIEDGRHALKNIDCVE
jgi:hypothetical protein